MDVSIIIINYNTREMTSECIDSIIDYTSGVKYEIILVDNASNDGSKEFFYGDKRVKYVYSEINRGFGAGNNIGVKHASGKYVFLLNSDTLLKNNAIKLLFDFSESLRRSCVCGGWLVDKSGDSAASAIPFPRMNIKEFLINKISKTKYIEHMGDIEVDSVCGADMFMPKAVYEQIGGFDEKIFMSGEETELQYRLKQIGIKRYIIAGPEIVHYGGASSKNSSIPHFYSHFYFLKKHMTRYNYYLARVYYFCNFIIRRILGNKKPSVNDVLIKIK